MTLIGDSINISDNVNLLSPTNATVGSGVEASGTIGALFVELDVDDDSFVLSLTNNNTSSGTNASGFQVTLSDLDWVGVPGAFITEIQAKPT